MVFITLTHTHTTRNPHPPLLCLTYKRLDGRVRVKSNCASAKGRIKAESGSLCWFESGAHEVMVWRAANSNEAVVAVIVCETVHQYICTKAKRYTSLCLQRRYMRIKRKHTYLNSAACLWSVLLTAGC